jgi:hypothetical protein
MAMNPRLLVPRANFDSDAQAYIRAVEVADTQPLEAGVKRAIDNFVRGLKQDNLWSAIGASCVLAGARTLAGALTPLKGGSPTNFNNNFVSGDYDRKTGLKGNGSTKSLNTNRAGNADGGQNDRHAAVYVSEATSASGAVFRVYIASTGVGADHAFFRAGGAATTLDSRFHSSTADSIAGAGAATGLIGSSRSNSADYIFRYSGSNNTITRASASAATGNYLVFTNNTASPAVHNDGRLAFYSIGTAIDLALLDARVSALVSAIGAAIP